MKGYRLIATCTALWLTVSGNANAQDDFVYEEYIGPQQEVKEGRTVLFTPKYVDVRQLQSVLDLLNAYIEIKPSLNLIAARSDDEQELETLERIITTLDVAPEPDWNIELTAHILTSSTSSKAAASIPAGLEGEIDRLESRFGLVDLKPLDTIFLRVGDGSGGRVEGSFPAAGSGGSAGYQFHFDAASLSQQADSRLVRLDALTLAVTGENPAGVHRALIRTDVEIPLGTKAMVGKATPQGTDDTLVLLVEAGIQQLQ